MSLVGNVDMQLCLCQDKSCASSHPLQLQLQVTLLLASLCMSHSYCTEEQFSLELLSVLQPGEGNLY
jgi:hypothetical protein